jgi:hypothetical protein
VQIAQKYHMIGKGVLQKNSNKASQIYVEEEEEEENDVTISKSDYKKHILQRPHPR